MGVKEIIPVLKWELGALNDAVEVQMSKSGFI